MQLATRTTWKPTLNLAALLTWLGIAVGAAVATVAWWPYLPLARASVPDGVQRFEVAERAHVQHPVTYAQSPPVGGDHAPIWQNCGFYATPVGREAAVHSLEHGAVWITYRPDLPPAQIDTLRRLAQGTTHVLVSPDLELPVPVVASAWGRQMHLGSAHDPRLTEFLRVFRSGAQAPERGGSCTGGAGAPLV
jgi:hypothetical protein